MIFHTLALMLIMTSSIVAMADNKNREHELLLLTTQTRLTHIDLDRDGRVDVVREFKPNGELKSFSMIQYREGGVRLVEENDLSQLPWQSTMNVFRKNSSIDGEGQLVESIIKKFDPFGRLTFYEHEYNEMLNDSPDIKMTTAFVNEETVETTYRRQAGQWVKVEENRLPRFLHQSNLSIPSQNYADCLTANGRGNIQECEQYAGIDPIGEFSSFAARYSNLNCVRDQELFSPSGFRVDLASCTRPASTLIELGPGPSGGRQQRPVRSARDILDQAMRNVTEERMACLATLNPEFARDCTAAMLEKRPQIVCANGMINNALSGSGMENYQNAVCAGRTGRALTSCRANAVTMLRGTAGFYDSSIPNNLYLTSIDPTLTTDWTDRKQDELESTLFHEMLHSCGHPGGSNHNHPHFNDEVYGCEAMCGGSMTRLSKEGCLACVSKRSRVASRRLAVWPPATNATEHSARRASDREFCNQFPSESVLQPIGIAYDSLSFLTQECNGRGVESSDCYKNLVTFLSNDGNRAVCGTIPSASSAATTEWRNTCIRNITARNADRILAAINGDGESLLLVADTLSKAQSQASSFYRTSNGELSRTTISMGESNCRRNKIIAVMGFQTSLKFCADISSTTTQAQLNALRSRYESKFPVHVSPRGETASLPIYKSSALSLEHVQSRCTSLTSNNGDGTYNRMRRIMTLASCQ